MIKESELMTPATTVLTEEVAVQTLRQIIEEAGPGFTYDPPGRNGFDSGVCAYKVDGTPSCIIGHLVARLYPEQFEELGGLERGELRGPRAGSTSLNLVSFPWEDTYSPPIHTETEALAHALRSLQAKQDTGTPWDQAFKEVFGHLEETAA